MQVIRIEDAKGRGPFFGNGAYLYNQKHQAGDCHDPYDPPGPSGEPFYAEFNDTRHHFAFKDVEQLIKWFKCPVGRAAMADAGYKAVLYETVEDLVLLGDWQVCFELDHSKRLKELPLDQLETDRKSVV